MNRDVITMWAERLDTLTQQLVFPALTAEKERFVDGFADGMGDRRPIDRPLLARIIGGLPHCFVNQEGDDAATAMMRAVGRRDVSAIRNLIREPDAHIPMPLIAEPSIATLEAETERELAAVHALASLVLANAAFADLRPRLLGAAKWLIAEIQPDNATHRPWAVHAFVFAAAVLEPHAAIDAEMYAQTLVHNAVVASGATSGKIDVFSLVLLRDAQQVLQRLS
ncbi:MAG: hypothetical protein KGS45_05175 [Planctomycetes bacterium]|nr:hypothetical protein [Planctomycetota bacterium]